MALSFKRILKKKFNKPYPHIPIYLYTVLALTYLLSPNSFPQEQSEVFLKGAAVTDIAEEEGFLWVETYGQGIYRYSIADGKWMNYSTKSGNLSDDLFYAVEVSKNFVWAASVEGLFTLTKKGGRWDKRKFAQGGEFGNWIRSLKYDEKLNVLWIGRFRNITRFDLKTRKYEDIDRTQGTDQKSNTIKAMEFDGDSLIWYGTARLHQSRCSPVPPAAGRSRHLDATLRTDVRTRRVTSHHPSYPF